MFFSTRNVVPIALFGWSPNFFQSTVNYKYKYSISHRLILSDICTSVNPSDRSVNFSYFHLLLQSHWVIFKQTYLHTLDHWMMLHCTYAALLNSVPRGGALFVQQLVQTSVARESVWMIETYQMMI